VSTSEIAHEMGVDEKEVIKIEFLMKDAIRLNDYVGEQDDESELMDFIPSKEESTENIVIKKVTIDEIKKIIDTLQVSDRDKDVFILRYGLNDGIYKNLEEVARTFKLSRERIRQIELGILKRIRRHINVKIPINTLVKDIILTEQDYVYQNLGKIGPRKDMERVVKLLDAHELQTLNLVFGRSNLRDGNIPLYKEAEFYNNVLPRIKEIYKLLKQDTLTKKTATSTQEKPKYDEILPIDILKVLNLLEKQVSKDFYEKLSYENRVILGFKLNDIGKNITDESVADYFGVSIIVVKRLTIFMCKLYKEYLENLDNKKYVK